MVHPASLDADELLGECDVRRVRRSGPGGQRRNKVETGIVLRHRPSGIAAEASERRSQQENQRAALDRLRLKLALGVRTKCDAATIPSLLWRERCRGKRLTISRRHDDFPALLAEALDAVACHDADVRAAADQLGCSSSQLIKLFKAEPRALAVVNIARRERGLHDLK